LWESDDPAENPRVAIDEHGLAHIVFTSAELGMHTVRILSVDLAGNREPQLSRLTSPEHQARLPVLAVRDGYLHLAYYQQTLIGAWAMYQKHELAAVRAVENDEGEVLVSWLAESGRSWQVYAVRLAPDGTIRQSGFATLVQGNVHGPDPQWAGALGIVSYSVPQDGGRGVVQYVHTSELRGEPWYFRAGFDPHSPILDAVFKYFTLLIGSIGLAFMGLGALAVSIAIISVLAHYGLFSSSLLGQLLRFLLQFLLLAGLKRPQSLLYYGAQFLPGWGAILSFALAAAVAFAVLYLTDLDMEDWPALGVAGIAFIASDAFVTLAVLGVGLW